MSVDEMVECEGCPTLLDPDRCLYDLEGCPLCDECVEDLVAHRGDVRVANGSSTARPAGNPCFECGGQVAPDGPTVRVDWPDGTATDEALCPAHCPQGPGQ